MKICNHEISPYVDFFVDSDGVLTKVINMSGDACELTIPKTLHQGEDTIEIKAIGSHCFSGRFSRITIADEIEVVYGRAFCSASVDTVVWSKGCKAIPTQCFDNCRLKRIYNIEDVTEIREYAFCMSSIAQFDWPAGCTKIPDRCFCSSCLKKISGIENVTQIGCSAFSFCSISAFNWPSGCDIIPECCFFGSNLRDIKNIDKVVKIGNNAFSHCKLDFVDMSNMSVVHIGACSFSGIPSKNVILPYYYPEDDYKLIFSE